LKIEVCRLNIYGIARAAQALAPRVAPSFLQGKKFLKSSIFNHFFNLFVHFTNIITVFLFNIQA